MNEEQLIKLDRLINDYSQIFDSIPTNSKFISFIEKYSFEFVDSIGYGSDVDINFYYNKELNIGINALFKDGDIIVFSILYFCCWF